MRHTTTTLALLGLVVGAVGCNQPTVGHFGDGAYYHTRGHYRIRYAGDDPELLPPTRWRLTNYGRDEETGQPTHAEPGHYGYSRYDVAWLTGQPRLSRHSFSVPTVDLHYAAREGSGEIWVRTMVLPTAWRNASAGEALHGALQAVGNTQLPLDPLGHRFAPSSTRITSYGPATIDERQGHYTELEVEGAGGDTQRVTLVALRPGGHEYRWHRRHHFPMMVVFGCASAPGDHARVRADLERLVRRVDIRR